MSLKYKLQQLSIFHWLILALVAINIALPLSNQLNVSSPSLSRNFVFPPNIVSIMLINSAEYFEFLSHIEKTIEPETKICYELGPFVQKESINSVEQYLVGREFTANIKTNVKKEVIGHWVFLKPERSRALGRLKVEEIKLLGLTDVMLLTNNNPRYAISLGFFSDKAFATRRLLKSQSLGLDAHLKPRYKNQDYQWLSLKVTETKDLQQLEWSNILHDYGNIELKTANCR